MIFLLFICAVSVLIFLCHLRKKSIILPVLLFSIGVLVIVCCNEGNDFKALQFRYDYWYFIEEFPIGFQWILRGAKQLNLSFEGIKLIFGIFAYSSLLLFYRKYSIWPALCCALVFIFPCDSFNGQVRNGIAAIIVIFALMYYLSNSSGKSTVVFIVLIVVATFIHPSSVVYLGAILVHRNIKANRVILFSGIIFIILSVGFYLGLVRNLASMITSDQRVLRWLNVGMFGNMFGSLSSVMGHVIWVLYISYTRRLSYPRIEGVIADRKILGREIIDRIYNLNLISMAIIPLYFVTHSYFRIFKYNLGYRFYGWWW